MDRVAAAPSRMPPNGHLTQIDRRSELAYTPSGHHSAKFWQRLAFVLIRKFIVFIEMLHASSGSGTMQTLYAAVFVVLLQTVLGTYPAEQTYGGQNQYVHVQQHSYGYYKKPAKYCYQCAYSPPKTYYDKKVVVEKVHYGHHKGGYQSGSYGYDNNKQHTGYGHEGGYTKKTYIPVARTVNGGWDKCLGSFDHYQAKDFGVDVWECNSNCYIRKDPNGDIFRGCYKGEYGVDPYRTGCSYQAGSLWCFCEGDKCNNQDIGYGH
ncbi:hypothetical protein LSH36_82g06015 [Paralvinella palmiformis]|uniref:Uncharacterized protein n=1 Tax=Paralvinella palmiformis TaxID=53620 RepID=A0AAD9K1S9_9ANNE|nr:hypothetical protein LSH36_82g06015 [Paralvinella palmiformis]